LVVTRESVQQTGLVDGIVCESHLLKGCETFGVGHLVFVREGVKWWKQN
jgi:hypothetical protein